MSYLQLIHILFYLFSLYITLFIHSCSSFHMKVCSFCFFSAPLILRFESIFSSPGGAYSIGRLRRPSVRRTSTISNDFSSETTGPIATKFHTPPPGPLGKKSCSNNLGQISNMAAMPIYGKNLKKYSSP